MTPRTEGALAFRGEVGSELSPEDARRAAALATRNALSAIQAVLPPETQFAACLLLTVYVRAFPTFDRHSYIADAASDVVSEVLGVDGRGARVAVGVASLPGGAPVEVQVVGLLAGTEETWAHRALPHEQSDQLKSATRRLK